MLFLLPVVSIHVSTLSGNDELRSEKQKGRALFYERFPFASLSDCGMERTSDLGLGVRIPPGALNISYLAIIT